MSYQQDRPYANNETIPLTSIQPSEKKWEDEIPPELEVYLETQPTYGLTDSQVAERLAKFGRNELEETKRSKLKHFLSFCKAVINF
jgi:H+-transporting ATPase